MVKQSLPGTQSPTYTGQCTAPKHSYDNGRGTAPCITPRRPFYDQNYITGTNDDELQRNCLIFGMEDYLDEESHLFMWKTTLCSSWYTLQNNGRHGRSERQLAMDGTLMVILLCLTLYYRVFYIIYNLHVFIYMRCIYYSIE